MMDGAVDRGATPSRPAGVAHVYGRTGYIDA